MLKLSKKQGAFTPPPFADLSVNAYEVINVNGGGGEVTLSEDAMHPFTHGSASFAQRSGLQYPAEAGLIENEDFTVEVIFKITDRNRAFLINSAYWSGGYNSGWILMVDTDGQLKLIRHNTWNEYTAVERSGSILVPLDTWTKATIARYTANFGAGEIGMWINGTYVAVGSSRHAGSLNQGSTAVRTDRMVIGSHYADGANKADTRPANIQSVRIVKGRSLYNRIGEWPTIASPLELVPDTQFFLDVRK